MRESIQKINTPLYVPGVVTDDGAGSGVLRRFTFKGQLVNAGKTSRNQIMSYDVPNIFVLGGNVLVCEYVAHIEVPCMLSVLPGGEEECKGDIQRGRRGSCADANRLYRRYANTREMKYPMHTGMVVRLKLCC